MDRSWSNRGPKHRSIRIDAHTSLAAEGPPPNPTSIHTSLAAEKRNISAFRVLKLPKIFACGAENVIFIYSEPPTSAHTNENFAQHCLYRTGEDRTS